MPSSVGMQFVSELYYPGVTEVTYLTKGVKKPMKMSVKIKNAHTMLVKYLENNAPQIPYSRLYDKLPTLRFVPRKELLGFFDYMRTQGVLEVTDNPDGSRYNPILQHRKHVVKQEEEKVMAVELDVPLSEYPHRKAIFELLRRLRGTSAGMMRSVLTRNSYYYNKVPKSDRDAFLVYFVNHCSISTQDVRNTYHNGVDTQIFRYDQEKYVPYSDQAIENIAEKIVTLLRDASPTSIPLYDVYSRIPEYGLADHSDAAKLRAVCQRLSGNAIEITGAETGGRVFMKLVSKKRPKAVISVVEETPNTPILNYRYLDAVIESLRYLRRTRSKVLTSVFARDIQTCRNVPQPDRASFMRYLVANSPVSKEAKQSSNNGLMDVYYYYYDEEKYTPYTDLEIDAIAGKVIQSLQRVYPVPTSLIDLGLRVPEYGLANDNDGSKILIAAQRLSGRRITAATTTTNGQWVRIVLATNNEASLPIQETTPSTQEPVMTQSSPKVLSAADLRRQIEELSHAAKNLEQSEAVEMIAGIKPIIARVRLQHKETSEILDKQMEAVSTMGMEIKRIGDILGIGE